MTKISNMKYTRYMKLRKSRRLVGLSISFCIKDICREEVQPEEVIFIVGDCRVENESDWNWLLQYYSKTYWNKFPTKAVEVANNLRKEGRLRFSNKKFEINIANGHWIQLL